MSIENAARAKQISILETIVKQLPAAHAATFRVVVSLIKSLGSKMSDLDRVCLMMGPLVARPKKAEDDKETRLKQARVAGQVTQTRE
jgi:hypothetical protein